MKLSELSATSGVPVPSIKYYLREGLLPSGASTGGRAASYDERHVARLGLIRALLDSAGLSIAAAREVVSALENPAVDWHNMLGVAQYALSGPQPRRRPVSGEDAVSAHLSRWGWSVSACSPFRTDLADALEALSAAGVRVGSPDLSRYAEAMHRAAEVDVAGIPHSSPDAALRHVVLGTVLLEPVLLAMRKLAQESVSRASASPGQTASVTSPPETVTHS